MLKNTGKTSEELFVSWVEGCRGVVYRFEDLYDARKKSKVTTRKPADFMVTLNGVTSYSEVKSTVKKSLSFKAIQPEQWRYAHLVTKAGGAYIFFIHFITLEKWFAVPARVLIESEKRSINVSEVCQFEFDINKFDSEQLSYQS